ncbi:MAG: ADP-ribosylglycohydrolase family protein [Deferrisomatales bacterium]
MPRWTPRRQQRRTVRNRFLGCLLGGAAGDALGAPVEFLKLAEIRARFGAGGIRDYAPAYGRLGAITDDTQLTLFTAEGLIRAHVRGRFRGSTTYPGVTAHAYLRWLRTQGEEPGRGAGFWDREQGWLVGHRELHHRRAPGHTCLAALRALAHLGQRAENDSKGCGGVMRVAPAGLMAWHWREHSGPKEAFDLGAHLAAVTHGHPTGQLSAGAFAVLVLALVDGAALPEALATAKACLALLPGHEETLAALTRAEALAGAAVPTDQAIRTLGQGWVAEEALAVSVYCALVAKSFEEGVILAVNHDGDSDSTGAMTGNLLGAQFGVRAIPERWLRELELRALIEELAADLFDLPGWDIGEYGADPELSRRVWAKYPGF